MARVSLSEFRAKSLLVKNYDGVSIGLSSLEGDVAKLDDNQSYVIKIDQGIKKRGKQGLIRLNVKKSQAKQAVEELAERGFERFLAEPMVIHDDSDEQYLSLERTRDGLKVLYSPRGGVEVENHSGDIETFNDITDVPLDKGFLKQIEDVMNREHFSFVEINPLLVLKGEVKLLDAAVLADSAGAWQASWTEADIVEAGKATVVEEKVKKLNDGSPSAFSFRVLNPEGSIWLLLSGGGASITLADEAANQGKADLIGNYGEYSGGPTGEETQVYADAVLDQVFLSGASKKALVIAGGVANFTDVKKTFAGIIAAFKSRLDEMKAANIKVFVRRGGPNEAAGLKLMEQFLKQYGLFGSVHGSNDVLTTVIDEAVEYVDEEN